jgi:hypothetical protein
MTPLSTFLCPDTLYNELWYQLSAQMDISTHWEIMEISFSSGQLHTTLKTYDALQE